ncbi:response regulator [Acidiphilium sp. PA]|uniref:chemotaxis protein CheB n=1 Tax=Acidiphilium sp. PA TaxID=2871705 RepID=UPI0022440AFF|nr:chemotaxis protein CheB [Acidiphilium sp. PA]MCW8309473.1 response regulator [Acidiphilium sp. PA]
MAEIGPSQAGKSSAAPQQAATGSHFAVVALGASAGGLEAFGRILDHLASETGMAFILVQHLDPTHQSLMVELLARHTAIPVIEASDGMMLEPDHVYVIPPGRYLAVDHDMLRVTQPIERHGMRLPFDFLLHSMAESCGARAIVVVLSCTGSGGSAGLRAIRDKGGFVIAQAPDEAAFDGMPRSAVATGLVDLVLPLAEIPAALAARPRDAVARDVPVDAPDSFNAIIALLRDATAHNFTLYKSGTLRRRIDRRIGLAGLVPASLDAYLALLTSNAAEVDLLAQDLLINVTSFFRDRAVFDVLEQQIVPELVAGRTADQPLRLWVAGCSSGEETYSLAMLFMEHISAVGSPARLQIFASDVDPDAVGRARAGLYDQSIEADVSPARLARFFIREEQKYRIGTELRALVVFTVQDVLADPPFSRLDLVSCRNLLIYLRAEAQSKILTLFHFALRDGGILLLGSAETIGSGDQGFSVVAKAERIYRRTGRNRPGVFGFPVLPSDKSRLMARQVPATLPGTSLVVTMGSGGAPQVSLAELCRRMVIEAYAPAAVLINGQNDCLFTLGPVDRFLQIAPGLPSHDVLAMCRQGLRTKLRAAIRRAIDSAGRVVVPGGTMTHEGVEQAFTIDVQPVTSDGERLLLICFVTGQTGVTVQASPVNRKDTPRVAQLERELAATRTELLGAIHDLELSSEDQKAINEEALSVNEEFQSTNEELLTSKEELQSLNEELTALNSQLQETLERQRTTANDLQNVLYSTDVATLFLDTDLHIRFFTPATRALFTVIQSDLGRPLADLTALTNDGMLTLDARAVLETLQPIEREVQGRNGAWFTRRVLPYRTQQHGVEGVVITFTDITERKRTALALQKATTVAEQTNRAKSRFLAAASHDLRQPLTSLSLLHGLLARAVAGTPTEPLVERMAQTLGVMTTMLDTLLDINEIEAGVVKVAASRFAVNAVFDRLRQEFTDDAVALGLDFHVMPCTLTIETDRGLLTQILRNLVSNALKYTRRGRILVGCRRVGGQARLEVWDTGIGIPQEELQAIFEEYHQIDNPSRNRTRGLGLGLAIVRRLTDLLGLPIAVRSEPGSGSVFSVTIATVAAPVMEAAPAAEAVVDGPDEVRPSGMIMVVEDDPDIRSLLVMFLQEEGYRVVAAADGAEALALVAGGAWPDLLIADYNLPGAMNGIAVVGRVRAAIGHAVPVIILTGDISTDALREIAAQDCAQFNKPMSLVALAAAIRKLMPLRPAVAPAMTAPIVVIDDDPAICAALHAMLEAAGRVVVDFASAEAFLARDPGGAAACLVIDINLPGRSGIDLLRTVRDGGDETPVVMLSGVSDATLAVEALRAGAADFVEKPVNPADLLSRIDRAIGLGQDLTARRALHEEAVRHLAGLTARQREILDLILAGQPSKVIAGMLGISPRTVEVHRAAIMRKTGAASVAALARLAAEADGPAPEPGGIRT